MTKKSKILLTSMATIAMSTSLLVGGTYALFTSESAVDIAVTSGKVAVSATVKDGVINAGDNNMGTASINAEGVVSIDKMVPNDEFSFDIEVTNTSNVDAWYRTIVETTEDNGLASALTVSFTKANGEEIAFRGGYGVDVWTYMEGVEKSEVVETITVTIKFVSQGDEADNKYNGDYSCKYQVRVEAVQGNAEVENPYTYENGVWYINNEEGMTLMNGIIGAESHGEGRSLKFALTDDMDMTGIDWTPIRMHWVDVDGQGHTVSNLNCGIDDWGRSGFVGYAGGANIKNITLKNVTAEGTQVGIVMGSAEGFMLENVKIAGTNSVKYNKLKNPKETWGGAGAVGGIASYANAASSVEIVSGARVTVDYNGLLTEAPIQNKYAQSQDISAIVTDNGTVTEIGEPTKVVKVEESAGKNAIANATASALANGENVTVELGAGEYTLPTDRTNTGSEITIKGTKDTVIDATGYTYLDNHKLSVEGVTINSRFAQVGSDYTAIYAPNATFTNCTINGAMLVGRDGVKFIGCTFNVTEDYIRTYGNDVTFENCTFNTIGKAILVYSDGNGMNTAPAVTVTGCTFKASQKGFAGAITNQACAAIEIDNYGCGVTLTTSGNTIDGNFSGIWRIKTYDTNKTANKVIANGTEYTSLAIDGKTMTINGKEVTVNN